MIEKPKTRKHKMGQEEYRAGYNYGFNDCYYEFEAYHRQSTKELLERVSRKLVRHQNDKRLSGIMNEFIDAELAKLERKG